MTDSSWKAFERTIANFFGGKRRGAYTGMIFEGKSDVIKDGWSIECKLLGKIGWQNCLDAVEQAKRNAESRDDIAVAVIKRKGDHLSKCLVVMELNDFVEHFVNEEAIDGNAAAVYARDGTNSLLTGSVAGAVEYLDTSNYRGHNVFADGRDDPVRQLDDDDGGKL